MKRRSILMLLAAAAVSAPAMLVAADGDPCLEKRRDIESQIEHARAHGNRDRLAGLERALAAAEANCTPEGLRQARERDAAEAAEKVAERERELAEARAEGKDADKIAKREAKLAEARDDLRRAREALDR